MKSLFMPESRKEREFRLREQEILDAAVTLFEEKGLDNVTVADIAKTTDIGKGTIYKHFVSKDAIMARLSYQFSKSVLAQVNALDKSLSCERQMRELFEVCFYAHIKMPLMSEMCSRYHQTTYCERLQEEDQQRFNEVENEYFVILSRILGQGVEENTIPNVSIDELLIGAHATFIGALEMLRSKQFSCFSESPQLSQKRFIENIINYTMTGIFGRRMDASDTVSGESHE